MNEAMEVKKSYTFRKLGAVDIAPMCKIISKIGIGEFSKCFESENIVNIFKKAQGKDKAGLVEVAGIQVALEIVNVIMTNIPKCEYDIFKLLASVSGLTVEEIKEFDLSTFTEMVIDFVKKEEFKDFFKVVSKLFK